MSSSLIKPQSNFSMTALHVIHHKLFLNCFCWLYYLMPCKQYICKVIIFKISGCARGTNSNQPTHGVDFLSCTHDDLPHVCFMFCILILLRVSNFILTTGGIAVWNLYGFFLIQKLGIWILSITDMGTRYKNQIWLWPHLISKQSNYLYAFSWELQRLVDSCYQINHN